MLIDDKVLDELLDKAAASPRLRMNMDMRTSPDDSSQRMLNALLPGTVLPIHRHTESTEVVTILRGRLIEIFYDNNGTETERILLDPREGKYALSIPVGQWHTVVPLEKSVIFEAKDKPFEPLKPEDTQEPNC